MKRVSIYIAVALAFIAAGVFVGARQTAPEPAAPSAVGAMLAQSLPDAAGVMQPLERWKGKPLVVNFWATWCAPCVKEMPALSALQAEIAPRGIQILGIGIDSAKNIGEFAAKYQIAYPLYVAGMGGAKTTRAFGNQAGGLPYTVLIDAKGEVRKTYLGELDIAELRRDLQSL